MGFFDWLKPKRRKGGKCFDNYQDWYSSLEATSKIIDMTLTVRVRAFGDARVKQAVWSSYWRSRHPDWGPAATGVTVSSDLPEVWMDLKKSDGKLILPPHVLGHELMHALKLQDKRLIDPDELEDL